MAIIPKSDLKNYFNTGDKPTEAQFGDLIDSFLHADSSEFTNISASGIISASNLISTTSSLGYIQPTDETHESIFVSGNLVPVTDGFNFTSSLSLGSFTAAWKDLFVSEDSIKFIKKSGSGEPEELARITIDTSSGKMKFLGTSDHKDLELRQTQFGKSVIKGATINDGGGGFSTFVGMSMQHRESGIKGGAIVHRPESADLGYLGNDFVAHSYQAKGSGSIAMLIDADLENGNRSFFRVEKGAIAGAGTKLFTVKDGENTFHGNSNLLNIENKVKSTGGSVIEEGVIIQPGVISQSLNIGTTTSPSVNIMDGVGDSCYIRIAEGITVRVNEGSIFKIQCLQPDITVDTDNDTITVSNGGGDETTFTTGQFGTNPQYIPMHMVVPSNQIAIWYGPIYVGRFTLNPFGNDFDPDGAGVLNMDLAGQGDNASLRIHNGAQIKIQSF